MTRTGTRDFRIDSVRGLLLVTMTLDHLGGPLRAFSWEPLGYVSAAEGFVLLSGLMFAVAYGGYVADPSQLYRKGLARALKVYKYQVVLALTISGAAVWIPSTLPYWRAMLAPFDQHPLRYAVLEVLLVHQPLYMGILPMYVVFAFMGPPILHAFHRGRTSLVFALSTCLWGLSQFVNLKALLLGPFYSQVNPGFFNPFAWQLLWVLGLWIGSHRDRCREYIQWGGAVAMGVAGAMVLVLFASRHEFGVVDGMMAALVDRSDLGPLRLLNLLLLAVISARVIGGFARDARVSWLALLGRHSLWVFSLHVGLLYLLKPIGLLVQSGGGDAWYAIYSLAVVSLLWLAAYAYERCLMGAPLQTGEGRPIQRV